MLECLLATLIIDLARAHDAPGDRSASAARPRVRVDAEVGRRGLAIEIASDGARPDPASWRFLLAMRSRGEAGRDARLRNPSVAAYVVQFR